MRLVKKYIHPKNNGAVLIISMIFVLVFTTLAVSMAAMMGTNVELASNHHKVNGARASAESGQEIVRYWLSRQTISASISPSNYFSTVITSLRNDLISNNVSNITINDAGSISTVILDSTTGQNFNAQISIESAQPNALQVYVTGGNGQITRTIKTSYAIGACPPRIFDYGLATKGPLSINGNPTFVGVNSGHEADIYIASENDNLALSINGNAEISGDISIGNPASYINLRGNYSIGGESGQSAIDNHIFIGVGPTEFPVPDTECFLQYATGDIIDSHTNTRGNMTLTNARVLAGTNPRFSGNVEILGILFIESPNTVQFSGNASITGLIVADGDVDNPSSQNKLTFCGNVNTYSVCDLPAEPQFDEIRQQTGSLILAPGFSTVLKGNFGIAYGVIAASGIECVGNVHGLMKGTIINYSDDAMSMRGNVSFEFDRSEDIQVPAGFNSDRTLIYTPSSYDELVL